MTTCRRLGRALWPVTCWVPLATLLFSGCAGNRQASLKHIRQRVGELAQAQAESEKQIEVLNNRIFILEDRVETSRVAAQRVGQERHLPVIRLRPMEDGGLEEIRRGPGIADYGPEDGTEPDTEPDLEGSSLESPAYSGQRPSSVVQEFDVKFRGDARRKQGARPMLRLRGVETAPATGTESLGVAAVPKIPREQTFQELIPQDTRPMRDYNAALTLYRTGQRSAAADAFRTFVKRHPNHDYADNAVYWLAECLYDMENHRSALKMFRRVVEEYPTGNKAPDALLKMGFTYLKLQEKRNAKTVLAQLVESFPNSQVARLATQTLVRIR